MNVTPPTILPGPFCNLAGVLPMSGDLHDTLSVLASHLPKHICTGYLVNANPPTIFKLCSCFCLGLKMCM